MTDKITITIGRDILEHTVVAIEYAYNSNDVLIAESIKFLRHALAQKAEPDEQEVALQEIADFGQDQEREPRTREEKEQYAFEDWLASECPSGDVEAVQSQWEESAEYLELQDDTPAQPAEPQCSPSQAKSLALLDLDSVEYMQGGANGPTIRLRGFINAQTGPTAPQPPIENAFVAEGCEQFSPPSEPAPVPCCGKYEACSHACTPRGKWLGRRETAGLRAALEMAVTQNEFDMLMIGEELRRCRLALAATKEPTE
jgi:hypothetical protein